MKKAPNKESLSGGEVFVGVDVQVRRGCAYFALSAEGREVYSGWGPESEDPETAAGAFEETIDALREHHGCALRVAIDAPRCPLPAAREWYWEGKKCAWRRRRPSERGAGRHCEVVVSALGLGRPQWTPVEASGTVPGWMKIGFALFERSSHLGVEAAEVFPSASLTCLEGRGTPRLGISLASFHPGKTDMLDALVAAATLREFVQGRGWEAPGGDGFGSIVLPAEPSRAAEPALLQWPKHARK